MTTDESGKIQGMIYRMSPSGLSCWMKAKLDYWETKKGATDREVSQYK